MILHNSPNPISMWHDLCSGWLSGQEEWVEDAKEEKHYSFDNLLSCKWSFNQVDTRGKSIASDMGLVLKPKKTELALNIRMPENGDVITTTIIPARTDDYDTIHVVSKPNGPQTFRFFWSGCEFPREYIARILRINRLFKAMKVQDNSGVIIHVSALWFSETTMPFLLPILGRRSFFDYHLLNKLNTDLERLDKVILKPDYPNKEHQNVWKRTMELLDSQKF